MVNYYFVQYRRWDVIECKYEGLEMLLPAETAADAKVFCDVYAKRDGKKSIPERLWGLERMEAANKEIYDKADHLDRWEAQPGSMIKIRFSI